MRNEREIEKCLIRKLIDLKYIYRDDITDRESLERNFREKFDALNHVKLTDKEFYQLREEIVSDNTFLAAQALREVNTFIREDGTPLHYTLVNIKDWCKNEFEVVNQLRINTDNSHHRYDVILLINGVPVAQIELKMLHITPRRAMEQIVQYKNDPGNGYTNTLLCFVQLFIISNESTTLYFANNNAKHFSFDADERFLPVYRHADMENETINHLHKFAEDFLPKCDLGRMIGRYMVLVASEKRLLIMRPYQIYAVKAIVDCIQQNRGNGYIWHTTGSGKTLTSFKAATLLKDNPDIEKCLFVVDRKDLDRQTREEFNRFQEGCVEQNTNTETLVERMLSEDYADKVIVTTIQKLGLALGENNRQGQSGENRDRLSYKERLRPLQDKRIVFIFDECHRSQFGENHRAIREFFPKAQLFGFTGTPIFEKNARYRQSEGIEGSLKTTRDIFEKELHKYTITNAIEDRHVLQFHIDYFGQRVNANKKDEEGRPTSQLPEPKAIVDEILEKHDSATHKRRFNAMLATASINDAIIYYELFKKAQTGKLAEDENYNPLNIACVFSPPAEGDKDIQQIQEDLPQEKEDNQQEPNVKKEALACIISDYNVQYGTNYGISEFDPYYQDIQKRIKDHEYTIEVHPREKRIDIVIVVDMLLTGFDARYLNTLYVDKNLRHHGLIQAFSRTNRVLNRTKPYGNILDFRYQEEAVNDAITLFSGEDLSRAKEVWLVDSASKVVKKFERAVAEIRTFMESHGLDFAPSQVTNLRGRGARVEFIKHFKKVQYLKNQLDQYTDLGDDSKKRIAQVMSVDELRGFRGVYLETVELLKKDSVDNEGEVSETDYELVLFASVLIDYDYIMRLLSKYTDKKPSREKMTRDQIIRLICSDSKLMEEREDLRDYIKSLRVGTKLSPEDISDGYQKFRDKKFKSDIVAVAEEHEIDGDALQSFVEAVMDFMVLDGERLSGLVSLQGGNWKERIYKERGLMSDLIPLLKKRAKGHEISGLSAYE